MSTSSQADVQFDSENTKSELEFLKLLEARAKAVSPEDVKQVEFQIIAYIEEYLHGDLRRILSKKKQARLDAAAGSAQFTELLQQFFVRILERFPTNLAQAQTRGQLLAYVAKALSNMFIDCTRKRGTRANAIQEFASLRESELRRDCPNASLDELLEHIQMWSHGSEVEQTWSRALELYYLIGMTQGEVGSELGCSPSTAERRITEALKALSAKVQKT